MLNNLPIQLTNFIGREQEIAEVKRLLTTTRLLMLTGSGGTGKTRLALQVAADVLDGFADGVWFIELAPISDPALVPITVASVLGVGEEPGRPLMATLLEWLRPKHLLFILDNCEHLIAECAKFADSILRASRETPILATSREALGIAGESAWRVPSLPTPNPTESLTLVQFGQYAAIQLFSERATQALATFRVTNANAPAIAQICFRLDGIPLAIELAAARVRALPVEQIAARLDDRFHLLTGGSRTALARHQTLRATMDWSQSLLTVPECVVLRRLSVFAGGWTMEAAEAVCADVRQDGILPSEVLDLLTYLVDKSLVVLDGQATEPRYRMLETMRQYAREKLLDANESEALRDRHLSYFLRLAEDAEPHLTGPAQATWFARLERDYANLRTAHEWSLQDLDASRGMRLATALVMLWIVRGPLTEGVDWLVRAVSRPEAATPSLLRANALYSAAWVLSTTGELVRSNFYGEESLAISRALEYRQGVARALLQLGTTARWLGDLQRSRSLLEQSLAFRQELDTSGIVRSLVNLGWIVAVEGDYDAAHKYLEQALSVAQAAENSHPIAFTYVNLGALSILQRDFDRAEAAFAQGLNAGGAIGYKAVLSLSSRGFAYVALQRGQVERAAALCLESLRIDRERRDTGGLAASLAACAALAVAQGRPERSARLYGSAAARLGGNGALRHRWPHDQAEQERNINKVRSQLDEVTFNASWQAGYALTLGQAMAEAEQAAQPERSSAPASAMPANSAGLTAREAEVLRWLAKGLSDIEISEQLVISPHTVHGHLRSIYGKLDVTSRTAAVRVALDSKII